MSSRRFCYTLNNFTEKDLDHMKAVKCRYHVIGQEKGESGTPHLQGYIEFSQAKTVSAARKICPTAHWEISMGNSQQASDYCKKELVVYEGGERSMTSVEKGVGEKRRWEECWDLAKAGKIQEIDAELRIRYYQTFLKVAKDYMPKPEDLSSVCGYWYYGQAGFGKSHLARYNHPGYYEKMANKWWDGYQNEEVVLIDDLDVKHDVLAHHLKIWSDRYAFIAETKGGALRIRPKVIVVTSQYRIDQIWPDLETQHALQRRFKEVEVTDWKKREWTQL